MLWISIEGTNPSGSRSIISTFLVNVLVTNRSLIDLGEVIDSDSKELYEVLCFQGPSKFIELNGFHDFVQCLGEEEESSNLKMLQS